MCLTLRFIISVILVASSFSSCGRYPADGNSSGVVQSQQQQYGKKGMLQEKNQNEQQENDANPDLYEGQASEYNPSPTHFTY